MLLFLNVRFPRALFFGIGKMFGIEIRCLWCAVCYIFFILGISMRFRIQICIYEYVNLVYIILGRRQWMGSSVCVVCVVFVASVAFLCFVDLYIFILVENQGEASSHCT